MVVANLCLHFNDVYFLPLLLCFHTVLIHQWAVDLHNIQFCNQEHYHHNIQRCKTTSCCRPSRASKSVICVNQWWFFCCCCIAKASHLFGQEHYQLQDWSKREFAIVIILKNVGLLRPIQKTVTDRLTHPPTDPPTNPLTERPHWLEWWCVCRSANCLTYFNVSQAYLLHMK